MAQTQYRNLDKGCEGILPHGKGLQNSRKLRIKIVVYKTGKLEKKRLRKRYLIQKVFAPNLFSLTNQLHILCFLSL